MLGFLTWVFTSLMEFVAWICFVALVILGIAVGNLVGDGEFNFWVALLIWVLGTIFLAVTFGLFGAFLTLVKNVGEISENIGSMPHRLDYLEKIFYSQEKMLASLSNSTEQSATAQKKEEASVISCKNCGKQLNEGVNFCVACGTRCE